MPLISYEEIWRFFTWDPTEKKTRHGPSDYRSNVSREEYLSYGSIWGYHLAEYVVLIASWTSSASVQVLCIPSTVYMMPYIVGWVLTSYGVHLITTDFDMELAFDHFVCANNTFNSNF